MKGRSKSAAPLLLRLDDPGSRRPLHRQVYCALRRSILQARVGPGVRLPSSRTLAADLGLSRTTVLRAFEQLSAEGFVTTSEARGTFVSMTAAQAMHRLSRATVMASARSRRPVRLSSVATTMTASALSTTRQVSAPRAFRCGATDSAFYPLNTWRKLTAHRVRMVTSRHLHYGESAGYAPLREAIASHVFVSRGVPCTADHVIITSGAQQGLSLIAHLLLDPGDHVLMEDPGYPGARRAFALTGARVVPLPVDASGFDIHAGVSVAPDARMVYVTPAHQYPLGVTLELARRAALLRWAGEAEAWIVEDDYDGEFQYDGPTPMALHGLDRNERVLYVGTFSATLFPSLRLGFVVVPGALVDAARAVRTAFDIHPAWLDQAVLADFIDKGHYARHLRRMRQVYQERYHALREAIGATCGELITLLRGSGLQVVGTLSSGRSDLRVAGAALTRGVEVTPLSPLYTSGCQSGLLLGFGGVDIPAIKRGCEQLAGILAWAVSQPTAS